MGTKHIKTTLTVIEIYVNISFISNFWPEILKKIKQKKNTKIYWE